MVPVTGLEPVGLPVGLKLRNGYCFRRFRRSICTFRPICVLGRTTIAQAPAAIRERLPNNCHVPNRWSGFARPFRKEPKETVSIGLHYRGFEPLRSVRFCLLFEGGYYWRIVGDVTLAPGEEAGPKYLEIPRSALPGLRLHVSWPTPHPSTRRRGLRYQALRVNLNHELEEWRWFWPESLLRRLKLPLGRWRKVNNPQTSEKSMPGWPHGRAAKTIEW